jgi:hypothetical protein
MADDNKKWYQVEGFSTVLFGFNVQASSAEEAQQLFWESDVELLEMQYEVSDMDILEATECEESRVTHDLTHRLTAENPSTHTVGGPANGPTL